MRTGVYVNIDGAELGSLIHQVRAAAGAGLDSVFFSQLMSWDALTVAALAGAQVPGIELGTAVVQTYPRHPIALAGQALTAQVASGNRLTLGIGPSHAPVIEGVFGYSYERPARHVREYLETLLPLLRGDSTPGSKPPQVLLSALGPVMLRIAGELTDGTVTVWTTAETVADHIAPKITRAASDAGRPAPRIVASVITAVTAEPDRVRGEVARLVSSASELPSYRKLLERQGLSGVQDTAILGDESVVTQAIRRYADAGATELLVSLVGTKEEKARTLEVVSGLR
jgi:F420-dependent oxidoreductase-like protein